MIADKCMLFVPKKCGKKKVITSFLRKIILQICKKHSICQSEVGPFLGPTKALFQINMRYVVYYWTNLIVFFTKPNPDMIVTQSSMDKDNELYLTNIVLSEKYY